MIAELDGAFTDYRELTLEGEYRKGKAFVRGSYTRSRYYGNFDQDNSTTADSNDANIFIGSSNIGDGAGRQLWDIKLGTLRGDRPNAFKIYGSYFLTWNASVGAFVVAQSGQPWEKQELPAVRALTTNTSDTDRYAEPAGSHRATAHAQLDLNYTQDLPFLKRYRGVIDGDLFNVFDSQTGYNIEPNFSAADFGMPRTFFDPRRLRAGGQAAVLASCRLAESRAAEDACMLVPAVWHYAVETASRARSAGASSASAPLSGAPRSARGRRAPAAARSPGRA